MTPAVLLWLGLLSAGDVADYARALDADSLDQKTLDAESYGLKKGVARGPEGVTVTVAPGEEETGWKLPPALRIGGDFTVIADLVVKKLPKPALEDGAAVGLAVATQSVDQPDLTLVRLTEPDGKEVYRSIAKEGAVNPQQMMMAQRVVMMGGVPAAPARPGAKPPKLPRPTFPAKGEAVRFELRREGGTVRYYVTDGESSEPRYLGQFALGTNDLAGAKLFVSNRNGAEPIEVVFKSLTVRAAKMTGLGTTVRTVYGERIQGDPVRVEDGRLVLGEPADAPTPQPTGAQASAALPAGAVRSGTVTVIQNGVAMMRLVPAQAAVVAAPPQVVLPAPAPSTPAAESKSAAPTTANAAPKAATASVPKPNVKARVPLDEVESIHFEKAVALSGKFLGQPNLDFTMPGGDDTPGGAPKPVAKADDVLAPPPGTKAPEKIPKVEPRPNGVRDLHLALAALRPAAVKQVTVACPTDKGQASWRLDTSDSKDWPLALKRAGTEPWADLFLEPPAGDVKGKAFAINITYADGQAANLSVNAGETASDPKLAFDPASPAPTFDARVYLVGDEQLFGRVEGLTEESIRLKAPWGDVLEVPLARVKGVYMSLPDHKETPESFVKRLKTRGTEDVLLARSKDGEVVAISGVAEGTEGDKLRFLFQDKPRTLPLKQVEGLVLADRPEPDRPEGPRARFSMAGGLVVSGRWKSIDPTTWEVTTDWGQELALPAADVIGVRSLGGQVVYLSDLEPSRVEEAPYFGGASPWRRDVGLSGGPLVVDGRTYEHGLAVHSRTELTYEINGEFARFEALVGFDDAANGKGRVDCRVLADGKELFANPDLRADAPPTPLSLPVAGANELRLVVDYGADEDTGDRVIWADARLFRREPPEPKAKDAKPADQPEGGK